MQLEDVIKQLKKVKCTNSSEKKNIDLNIKLCGMQIAIRDKLKNRK